MLKHVKIILQVTYLFRLSFFALNHFAVDLMEMNFTHFIAHIVVVKCYETKTCQNLEHKVQQIVNFYVLLRTTEG